jgi:hypothetical protein
MAAEEALPALAPAAQAGRFLLRCARSTHCCGVAGETPGGACMPTRHMASSQQALPCNMSTPYCNRVLQDRPPSNAQLSVIRTNTTPCCSDGLEPSLRAAWHGCSRAAPPNAPATAYWLHSHTTPTTLYGPINDLYGCQAPTSGHEGHKQHHQGEHNTAAALASE